MLLSVQAEVSEGPFHALAEITHLDKMRLDGKPESYRYQKNNKNIIRQVRIDSLNNCQQNRLQ